MKIDTSVKLPSSNSVKETPPRAAKAESNVPGAAPQGKAVSPDNVQITTLSSQLQAMESSMGNEPVVNRVRVEEIKLAISEGRFKINPEVIADSLMATVNDLLQNQKGKY